MNTNIQFQLLICLSIFLNNVRLESFTSTEKLIELTNTQQQVTKILKETLNKAHQRLKNTQTILDAFEKFAELSQKAQREFMTNPVNSFLVIKLLTRDLGEFFRSLDIHHEIEDSKNKLGKMSDLPLEKDFKGAISALLRLAQTYQLNPTDLQQGIVGDAKYKAAGQLDALSCFELGKLLHEKMDFDRSLEWLHLAMEQIDPNAVDSIARSTEILELIAESYFKKGNLLKSIDLTNQIIQSEPNAWYIRKLKQNLERYKTQLGEVILDKIADSEILNLTSLFETTKTIHKTEETAYESLCRGDGLYQPDIKVLSQLKCRYASHHPLIRIAPVKQEQLSIDPPIWIFYDVIRDDQIRRIIDSTKSLLERAKVVKNKLGEEEVDYRISQIAWLSSNSDNKLVELKRYISAITNLSMSTTEEWQVNNYGLGGFYATHYDYYDKQDDDKMGMRIATWMYYLEAPSLGGATVFPRIRVRAEAVKGAAVFWYNLLPSGQGDPRTLHAGCPVLVGSKWVCNKWVRADGEMFKRPCDLVK